MVRYAIALSSVLLELCLKVGQYLLVGDAFSLTGDC